MRHLIRLLLILLCSSQVWAETSVLASIKPVYGITLAVIQNTPTKLELLLPGEASEHDYHLKPSDLQKIKKATLIVWVGPESEVFLNRPFAQLRHEQHLLGLLEHTPVLLEERMGNPLPTPSPWKEETDPHAWLHPENAIAWAKVIAERLAKEDPAYAAQYRENAKAFERRIAVFKSQKGSLSTEYVVYHDAFQYFDAFFGSKSVAAIHSHLEDDHHVSGILNLESILKKQPIAFLGTEPYVQDRLLVKLSKQFHRPIITLDPLGILIEASPDYYDQLITYHLNLLKADKDS